MKNIILLSFAFFYLILSGNSQSVYTCKGTSIPVLTPAEGTTDQKNIWRQQFLDWGASHGLGASDILDEASGAYNCHAYAWHLREGNTNKVWINNATYSPTGCQPQTHNIDTYWTDNCFVQVCNSSDADKIHYYCGDHSAVQSTVISGKYESKWGNWPVIRHDPTNVPYEQPTSVNYYSSTKISGDISNLCSGSRTFMVKNISGATYTWTYSNGLSAVGATNQSSLTVQRSGTMDGDNWVEVQISTPCSTTPVTNRIYFTVGGPTAIDGINTEYVMIHCNVVRYKWIVVGATSATTYKWYYRNITQGQITFPTTPYRTTSVNWVGSPSDGSCDQIEVLVEATNACNSSNPQTTTFISDLCPPFEDGSCTYGRSLVASPNPTSGTMQLQLVDDPNLIPQNTQPKQIQKIRVIDKMGQIKKQINGNSSDRMTINIADLPSDIYTILVYDGKAWLSTQVVKN